MMLSSPIAASISSAAALADELDRFRVLPRERLGEAMVDFPGGGALGLAQFLIARGELAPYQAERTLAGHARSLLIGAYRIIEPDHVGTFGPIFRAVKGDQAFAIRVLPLRSLWQAKQAKQLVRTLAALGSVPTVVPLIDADSANGCHYLAWPLVVGESLAERISSNGIFEPVRVLPLLTRLAAALASCHGCQIVHGLLTPHAICLQADGTPKLLEVGAGMLLAKNLSSNDSLFDTMSSSLAVAGAVDFAAPEWVADPAHPTPAADQYSLGAIGCFVLTGSPPESGTGQSWPENLPRELTAILDRMLQPDPAARYAGLDEVWAALVELGGSESPALLERNPSEQSSVEVGHGPTAWSAVESMRPIERDNTDASIHFDLPEEVEEAAPARGYPPYEARETPPPSMMPTSANAPRPEPTPPPKSRFLATRGEKRMRMEPPPSLPATPLPPLGNNRPSSATWDVSNAKHGSSRPTEGKSGSSLWMRMKRKAFFWQTEGDTVQLSVFGPKETTHSESPRLTVFVHSPSATDSVATLAHAFHHDAVLLGTATLMQTVARGERLDLHVSIAHISVTNPLGGFRWQGQPQRQTFEFVVPWEAPVGIARGVISVGREEVRIGKLEFDIPIHDGNG